MAQVVAENIASFMKLRDMNAASLARKAKTNPTGIYDILSGKSRSPRLDTVKKIADALDVPVSQLLERSDDRELRTEIVSVFAKLPPSERRRLIQAAHAWLPSGSSEPA